MLGIKSGPGGEGEVKSGFDSFIDTVTGPINLAFVIMLALIGTMAIVFAVWVAFKLAKAEDEGKRKEAKQQLMWAVIAVGAIAVMFVLFNTIFDPANGVFGANNTTLTGTEGAKGEGMIIAAGNRILWVLNAAVGAIIRLLAMAAMLYAVYVGVQLAMAADEGKRKEAKARLLWSMIAIVGALVLSMVISMVMTLLAGAM